MPCSKPATLAAQAEGLAIKWEPHTNRVPRSQRGGEVVEPLVRPCSDRQGHAQFLCGIVLRDWMLMAATPSGFQSQLT